MLQNLSSVGHKNQQNFALSFSEAIFENVGSNNRVRVLFFSA